MYLIKNQIIEIGSKLLPLFCAENNIPLNLAYATTEALPYIPPHLFEEYAHAIDFTAASEIAKRAQTLIMDTNQVLQFIRGIDRKLAPGNYPIPFNWMSIQFTGDGIPENLFTTGLTPSGDTIPNDTITAILFGLPNTQPNDPDSHFLSIVAWYKSTAMNRILLPLQGDGTIADHTLKGEGMDTLRYEDKQRLANLAMMCIAYITTPGVTIMLSAVDPKINRKREAKGKRILEDYYECLWTGNQNRIIRPPNPNPGTGTPHSFRYDVCHHWRTLRDGRVIWIPDHQRGLDHETYKPKVYRVK